MRTRVAKYNLTQGLTHATFPKQKPKLSGAKSNIFESKQNQTSTEPNQAKQMAEKGSCYIYMFITYHLKPELRILFQNSSSIFTFRRPSSGVTSAFMPVYIQI